MASLDAARAQVQARGKEMAEAAVAAASKLRSICSAHAGLKVLEESDCNGLRLDSTKVTVNFANWGYTGVEVGDALRRARVAVELVDAQNVLFLVTYADVTSDYDAALARIDAVLSELERHKREPHAVARVGAVPVTSSAMKLRDVFYARKRAVGLETAIGCVCGEQVSFYPPGIPVLLPGEAITREIVEYCKAMKQLGLPVSGPADSSLDSIRVVE